MKLSLTSPTINCECGADTPVRAGRASELLSPRRPSQGPQSQPSSAPEGRPIIAQRFSAGKNAQIDLSPGGTIRFCFGVAQRFSAAMSGAFSSAALAAEVTDPTFPAAFLAAEGRRARPVRRALQSLLLAAAVILFLGAGGSTESRFNNLGHRMMCTCGCGQVLLECNHVGCQSSDKMRNQLQAALDRGDNDDLILQGFVQEYGPTVIAAPTSTGFNKVAWIMPFVALALGIVFVTWVVQAWKNRPAPALADGISIPPGKELDQFRAQARKETDL